MCGRYSVITEKEIAEIREIVEEIDRRYKEREELRGLLEQMKLGEIFPTNVAPVIAVMGGQTRAGLMKWGFPLLYKPGVSFNAVSEDIKPMFAKSFEQRRCVVPSTGFYEWSHVGKKAKDKFLINHADQPVLYIAGVYNTFKDKDGKDYRAYSIMTKAANKSITPLHDRMPVILGDASEREAWMRDYGFARELLRREDNEEYMLEMVAA